VLTLYISPLTSVNSFLLYILISCYFIKVQFTHWCERAGTALVVFTVELHLSGLIGTTRHPDKQNFRIIGIFFENKIHWQFEVGVKSTYGCFRLHIYLRTNDTVIPYMYLKCGGKVKSIKRCSTSTVLKYLPERPSRYG
jgi:hypothetical protein